MKRWWWNVRYAYWIWRACGYSCTLSFAWGCACADEGYDEGDYTPREAVDSELTYWGE